MSVIDTTSTVVQPVEKPNMSSLPAEGTERYNDILKHCKMQFEICRSARLQYERQWYLNIAFYRNRQYVQWASGSGSPVDRLIVPGAPKWRVRLISNQIRRYARKEYSKVIQESPTGYVMPASGEDSDIAAAKAGDAIIDYTFKEAKVKRETRRAIWWAVITGTGFTKNWYNRKNPEEDSPGDMPDLEHVSPFHLFVPDVAQVDLEAQPFLFHCATKPKDWVRNTYGIDVPADSSSGVDGLEDKFLQSMGITDRNSKNSVYVKEAYFKPGGYFKDGAVVVYTENKLLWLQESWHLPFEDFPFTKIDNIPTGTFYAESPVTDLIPLQKEYNRTRSQIIEAKNLMARPQMTAALGSIDPNKVTSEPGQIIFYKPGYDPPKQIDLKPLPSYVIQEIDRNLIDMDNISSQHEVSRGQAPAGVEAATAISFLQEQDDSVHSDFISHIEEHIEKVGRHFLSYVNQNWDLNRKIQVVGLNAQLEAFEFSKANLNGNTDFQVQAGSATPRSKAAKQAMILDLMKNGYINPVQGLKHLEMAETGKLFEEMQTDSRHAQRENLKMNQGMGLEPVAGPDGQMVVPGFPVNDYDNHIIHITEHDAWRKRQEYESAPLEIKALFEQHVRMHQIFLCTLYGIMLPVDPLTGIPDPVQLNAMAFRIMNNIPMMQSGQEQEEQAGETQEAGV